MRFLVENIKDKKNAHGARINLDDRRPLLRQSLYGPTITLSVFF